MGRVGSRVTDGISWRIAAVAAALLIAGLLAPLPGAASARAGGREAAKRQSIGRRARKLFTNPVLGRGQDPSVTTYDGWYYFTQSSPDAKAITIRRSRSLKTLAGATEDVVWRGARAGSPCCHWWAPELTRISGRWYIYTAADGGRDRGHRLQVLQSNRPLGPYRYLGRLTTPGNYWSIDPSVLQLPDGRLFLFWSGWPRRMSRIQNIYIAAMRNPWHVIGDRVLLSTPTYPWERHSGHVGVLVNESPEPILHDSTISVTYSASACWTPQYALGLLTATAGANLLARRSWAKSAVPVFHSNPAARVYAPASNGWFSSPDGTQTWTAFAAVRTGQRACDGSREVYAKPVSWNKDGSPDLGGEPAPPRRPLEVPSGDPGAARQ